MYKHLPQDALKGPHPETTTLRAALDTLAAHGVSVESAPGERRSAAAGADAIVQITLGGKRLRYAVQVKRWLTPGTLGSVVHTLRGLGRHVLLVTDYATPQVADCLKSLDIPFADAAGNAYLHVPPVLIWVTGRKGLVAARRPQPSRIFQPSGLKVLFAFLCRPDLVERPYRDIAAAAGVSNGSVEWIMQSLRAESYVVSLRQRPGGRRLRERTRLLTEWSTAFVRTLRPKLLLERYDAPTPDWWRSLDPTKYQAVFGGEAAAALLGGGLRPGRITLYLTDAPGRLILDQRLVRTPEGPIELRRRFWPFEYAWEHPTLAPPVLIYADLLAVGDARCLEAAEQIHDAHLIRLLRED